MHPKRISYRQIAVEAGVSYKTLYRVLNREPCVAEATRKKIIRIMKRHGCMDARLPAGCGIVIYVDDNNYMKTYARLLVRKLQDFPVGVRLFHAAGSRTAFLRAVGTASRLVYFEFMPEPLLKACRDANPDLKVLCISGDQGDVNIGCDYFRQGEMAAEYLQRFGVRSLGIVCGNVQKSAPLYWGLCERVKGCLYKWVHEYGHDEPEQIGDLDAYFARERTFPAVFLATNTYLSNVFIGKAAARGLKLPEDYGLLTFGRPEDTHATQYPAVDCIYHEPEELLELALTFLFYPNLGEIHSQVTLHVQSRLQLYGTVRAAERPRDDVTK